MEITRTAIILLIADDLITDDLITDGFVGNRLSTPNPNPNPNLWALRDHFRDTRYHVISIENLNETITIVQREHPNLIMIDFTQAPAQKADLCEQIHTVMNGENIKIIALTPDDEDVIHMALNAGVDDCICHPILPVLMMRRVQNLLQETVSYNLYPDDMYQRFFEASNEAIYINDAATGQIIHVNTQLLRWLGYTRKEMLNMTFEDIEIPPEDDEHGRIINDEMSTNGSLLFEQNYRHKSGEIIPAEVNSKLFAYEGRRVVMNSIRDIRKRKRMEAEENQQRQLAEALRDIANTLNSTLRLDEVMQRVLEHTSRTLPGDATNIMLVENQYARMKAYYGYTESDVQLQWVDQEWSLQESTPLGWMYDNHMPIIINDVRQHPLWKSIDNIWTQSYLGTPIMVKDRVIGFLNIDSKHPYCFDQTHADLLQAFANQAAVAIDNALLHESIQRHAEELETNITKRTLELMEVNLDLKRQMDERKRAEAELQRERNTLRTLIDNIPDEIYVKDRTGRIIVANEAYQRRLRPHAPHGEVIGSSVHDYIPEITSAEKANQCSLEEQQMLAQGRTAPLIQEMEHKDPRIGKRWLLTTRVPLYDDKNQPQGIIGVNHDVTQLHRVEERLTHIISGARCLLWYANVTDKEDEGLHWDLFIPNDEAAQQFLPLTLQTGESYADKWQQSILPGDRQTTLAIHTKSIRTGQRHYNYEFRCLTANGEIRWLSEDVQVKHLTGNRYSLVGVCTDITERKLAEETLVRSNELLEQRVEERTSELIQSNKILKEQITERRRAEQSERTQRQVAEALISAAEAISGTLEMQEVLDRLLAYVSLVVPAYERANVIMVEDTVFARLIRIWIRDDKGDPQSLTADERIYLNTLPTVQHVVETGEPYIIADTTQDPKWMEGDNDITMRSYIGVPISSRGRIIGCISLSSREISQFNETHAKLLAAFSNQAGIAIQNARLFETVRLQSTSLRQRVAEQTAELEYERAQLRAILDAMTEGVIYTDTKGHVRYVNQHLTRLTGYFDAEWRDAHPWTELVIQDKSKTEELNTSFAHKVLRHGIWKQELKMVRKDQTEFDSEVVTTQVRSTNGERIGAVTVVRDVSTEKRLAEQKARFIATASHELRTPITNMKTRIYLVKRQPEKLAEHLEVISMVTERMRELVENLLDLSRFEHGIIKLNFEDIILQELIEAVIRLQQPEADKKSIDFITEMPEAPVYGRVDRSRMEQVITNLVTNAINYTPDDGHITIKINVQEPNKAVYISICDTGIGIPKSLLPDVFKPFFRVSDGHMGMGLGLSITREIVELHNAKITVKSKVNEGTCFIIKLAYLSPDHLTRVIPPFVE